MSDPLLLTVPDILKTLSIGRSKFYELVSTGQFAPQPLRVFGKKKLYKYSEVKLWVSQNCPNRERFAAMQGCKYERSR